MPSEERPFELRQRSNVELVAELVARLAGSHLAPSLSHLADYAVAHELTSRLRYSAGGRFDSTLHTPNPCPECGVSTSSGHCVIAHHGDSRWSLWDCGCGECRKLQRGAQP